MIRIKASSWITWFAALVLACGMALPAFAQQKPNILVICLPTAVIEEIQCANCLQR